MLNVNITVIPVVMETIVKLVPKEESLNQNVNVLLDIMILESSNVHLVTSNVILVNVLLNVLNVKTQNKDYYQTVYVHKDT